VQGPNGVDGWGGEGIEIGFKSLRVRGWDEGKGLEVFRCDLPGVSEICDC
jgi:hypothetical protein